MEGRREDMLFESDINEVFDFTSSDREVSDEERSLMSPASYSMYTQHDIRSDTSSKYGANFPLPREPEFLVANSTTEQVMEIHAPSPMLQRARGKVLGEEEEVRQDEAYNASDADDDEGIDGLIHDLIEAQGRLHERDKEIARKDEELEKLQGLVSNLTATQEKEILGVQDKAIVLQQTVDRLTAELEEKDRDLRSKESELSKRNSEWDTTLQQLEQQRKEQLEELRTEIGELRKRNTQSDSRLDEAQEARRSSVEQKSESIGVKELETGTVHATESELERITAQATEIVTLRSLLEFFKSNSESVASKNKEVMEENRRMQEAVEVRDLEIEEQRSLISILSSPSA